jgi:hypothetical protein
MSDLATSKHAQEVVATESMHSMAPFRPFFAGILLLLITVPACAVTCLAMAFFGYAVPVAVPWVRAVTGLLTVGNALAALFIFIDLKYILRKKRRKSCGYPESLRPVSEITVALTAYNDEEAIASSVIDFISHPLVKRVIVVSNNSKDRTIEVAQEAGAVTVNESKQGYGYCVHRCFQEALRYGDAEWIVLCEGDRTFRAFDLDKIAAYAQHAEIVSGTRIVEQLREYHTQLSTFMFYGNFFVGKLLEAKHLGAGTFTDVGTTYKMLRRETLVRLLPKLDPSINLEFNAYFLDTALRERISMVECPITFHARVGESKGGNVNNLRALKVGMRMILGLTFGWKLSRFNAIEE